MKMKKFLLVITIMLFSLFGSLIVVAPSYAARIYNDISVPIVVRGLPEVIEDLFKTEVSPQQRSESLNWEGATEVTVFPVPSTGKEICTLGFGPHYNIVGGNYMGVSGNYPESIQCVVCDSNHNAINGAGNC